MLSNLLIVLINIQIKAKYNLVLSQISHFMKVINIIKLLFFSLAIFVFLLISIKSFAKSKTANLKIQIPILGFHDVVDLDNPSEIPPLRREFDIDYSKAEMEKLLIHLAENNYWFLSTGDFYDYFLTQSKDIPEEFKGKKPIMITFDDGYRGVYSNLLPVLRKIETEYSKKIKVVLFINPALMGIIDQDLVYVNCQELKEGYREGFYDIQSHSFTHYNLTELDDTELDFELAKADIELKKCIGDLDFNKVGTNGENLSGRVAAHLAYPFGASNEKVEQVAGKYYLSGYLYNNKIFETKIKNKNNSVLIDNKEKNKELLSETSNFQESTETHLSSSGTLGNTIPSNNNPENTYAENTLSENVQLNDARLNDDRYDEFQKTKVINFPEIDMNFHKDVNVNSNELSREAAKNIQKKKIVEELVSESLSKEDLQVEKSNEKSLDRELFRIPRIIVIKKKTPELLIDQIERQNSSKHSSKHLPKH